MTGRPERPPHFRVGSECISCAACWRAVPEHFDSHPIEAYAIVVRQPAIASELERCEEARRICPVGAIRRGQEDES